MGRINMDKEMKESLEYVKRQNFSYQDCKNLMAGKLVFRESDTKNDIEE
jgi:hypothetical protein